MKEYTKVGTDIESVIQKNADSGMSYNEVKEYLARTTGGHGTAKYSTTNVESVLREINQGEQRQE